MGIHLRGEERQRISDQDVAAVLFPQGKILENPLDELLR
jgi:hypothetical protein